MVKKRIIAKAETETIKTDGEKSGAVKTTKRKTLDTAVVHIRSTYNNTTMSITDNKGGVVCSSSAGALGFNGAKKGTPFAAAKVGEVIGEKAAQFGVREVMVVVSGVGSGRESAIRGMISKGIGVSKIKDATPIPHNGPRPPKPRRV
jgi:small subunit ribosomal protein S11